MGEHSAAHLEVAVIGGGPAGAVAALLLARRGHRVTLIDRRHPHTAKTCGHCLHPRIGPLLGELGLIDTVNRIDRGRTMCVSIHAPGAPGLDLPLIGAEESQGGWLVDRASFDAALVDEAQAAGVEVVQPAKASIDRSNHAPSTTVRITADGIDEPRSPDLIVAADGIDSRVANAMGLTSRSKRGGAYGFSFDFTATSPDAGPPPGTIRMYLIRGGYLGLVRQDDSTIHAGALVDPRRNRIARDPARFVDAILAHYPSLESLRDAMAKPSHCDSFHAMSPMPCVPRRRANRVCALVGDAAGYIEPFTGEGMTWAIESAAILAETVRAHDGWNATAARRYERDWKRTIGRHQRRCALLSRGLRHPALVAAACRLAVDRSTLAARLARPFLSHTSTLRESIA